MVRLADTRSAPRGDGLPAGASPKPCSSSILTSEKYLVDAIASSRSHMAAPASLISDASEGNTCTTRDLRFISLLARPRTLLVLSLFQCYGGKSGYARASGSASSGTSAALGHTSRSMSQATWYMATAARAPLAGINGKSIRATRRRAAREPASRTQSWMRWTTHHCQAAPWKASPRTCAGPLWALETTRHSPEVMRPRAPRRKASQDSASTMAMPGTRLYLSASQPMAVATAVNATRPSRRHFAQVAPSQR